MKASITRSLLGSELGVSIGFINLVIRLKNVTGCLNGILESPMVWFGAKMLQLYKLMLLEMIMKSRSGFDGADSSRKLADNKC